MIPVYDVISGHTHLSLEGAQEFFQNGDAEIRLSQQPRHNELVPCEDISLGMQFDTMLAYNELLRTRPWTAQLSAIAEDCGPDRQAGGPAGPSPERSPERESRRPRHGLGCTGDAATGPAPADTATASASTATLRSPRSASNWRFRAGGSLLDT